RVGPSGRPLLTAASFAMDVELAPLLQGDVVIVDMRLEAPKVEARIDTNGTLFWPDFTAPGGDGAAIAVEALAVSDGIIRLRDDRFDREFILRDIDAKATAGSIIGPWRGDATLRWRDERVRLDFSTGRYRADDQAVSLRTRIEPQGLPYDFSFEGPVAFTGASPSATGLLRVSRASAADGEDRIAFPREVPEDTLPLLMEADVEIGPALLRLPAYELRVGDGDDPYTITGAGRVEIGDAPSFRLTAEGQQVNAERLQQAVGAPSGADLPSRLALLERLLQRLPTPPGEGQIDIVLPAFVAGDTVIRDIEATVEGDASPRAWRVKALSAQLPGRTELRADGLLSAATGLRYEGDLTLASRQPTGFATWLGESDPASLDGIANAGFTANATLAPGEITLDELEVVVNGDSLEGRLQQRDGRLSVALEGPRAHLDHLRALAGLLGTSSAIDSITDVEIDTDSAVFDGIEVNGLDLSAARSEDDVVIERLSIADVRGVTVDATGRVLADAPFENGLLDVSLRGPDLSGLLELAGQRVGPMGVPERYVSQPRLTSNADLQLLAQAEDGARVLSVEGTLGGNELDLTAELSADAALNARLVARADDGATLLPWLGVDALSLDGLGRGALRLTTEGPLEGEQSVFGSLTLRDGFASGAGTLTPALRDGEILVTGRIVGEVEASNMDPFIALSGRDVPGFGLGNTLRLSGELLLSDDEVAVEDLSGRVAGSSVAGRLTWLADEKRVVGGITLDRASADVAAALAYSPQSPLNGLEGAVELDIATVDMPAGLPPVENFVGQAIIGAADGDMALRDARGTWLDGSASGNVVLTRGGDGNIASIQGSLSGAQIEAVSDALEVPSMGAGRIDIDGTFEAFGETGADMVAGVTGTGSASVSQGRLKGVSDEAFSTILKAADATEDADLPSAGDAMVRAQIGNGELAFGETAFAFTVNDGNVRLDNVPLETEAIRGRARGRLDLASSSYEAGLDLTFDAGLEAVEGTTPSVAIDVMGQGEAQTVGVGTTGFTTYLNTRLAEKRERQFLLRRAAILERQRLRRAARYYDLKQQARRLAREEQERIERVRREEAEARRQEAERRRREAAEQARLEQALREREQEAAREAAAEAGRRARRQEELEDLSRQRERAREALQRLEQERDRQLNFDGLVSPEG
ncbi:MAG: AsmA-like C-terminal region-containing protein, partial [Pseudomonadota bacterium]